MSDGFFHLGVIAILKESLYICRNPDLRKMQATDSHIQNRKEWIKPEDIRANLIRLKSLCLEVTDSCNLACDYCVYRELFIDHDERTGKMMPFGIAKNIIDYLVSLWNNFGDTGLGKRMSIGFYGGEPLLNMELIESVISYARGLDTSISFSFQMTTNAMLLDRYADYLAANDVRLLISLDGDKESDGHRVRHDGTSSFSKVYDNVQELRKKHPKFFEKNVSFNSVLNDRSSVSSVLNFFSKEFDKKPMLAEINPRGLDPDKSARFGRMYRNLQESIDNDKDHEELSEKMLLDDPRTRELMRYILYTSGDYFDDYDSLLREESTCSDIPCPGTCAPFGKKLFVTVNGKVFQCERIGQDFPLGQVSDTRVDIDEQYIAGKLNTRLAKVAPLCSKCVGYHICGKCMYYIRYDDKGHPLCGNFLSQPGLEDWMQFNMRYLARNPKLYRLITNNVVME